MDTPIPFGIFDPEAEVGIEQRSLPHWFQPGVATFITFRTTDSMPREVVAKWKTEVKEWLTGHGIAMAAEEHLPTVAQLRMRLAVGGRTEGGMENGIDGGEYRRGASGHTETNGAGMENGNKGGEYRRGASGHTGEQIISEYFKLRDGLWHGYLDECHGACVLKDHRLAAIVLDSLKFFDGQRYDLDSAIIMPNHVHLIAQFRAPVTCRTQCESWLHYTAWRINRCIGRRGAFWQSEPFDHLIRSEGQFHYLRNYIAQNGIAARLPADQYLYWSR